MSELIRQLYPIAKKQYKCMAFAWLNNSGYDVEELTSDENEAIVKAKRNGGCIYPGERYLRQACKGDCGVYTFIAKPELHEICLRLNLYEN